MVRVLYGGTFDPVHNGHLAIARAAAAALSAEVHLLPAADPPHRPTPGGTAAQRLRLLQLAVADEPVLRVDDRELRRAGPSYSVLTLSELRRELGPDVALVFVLGADAFLHLHRWHRAAELFGLAHFLVVAREGSTLDDFPPALQALCGTWRVDTCAELVTQPAGRWCTLPMTTHPASATAIRAALAQGEPTEHLPAAVSAEIAAQGWYR